MEHGALVDVRVRRLQDAALAVLVSVMGLAEIWVPFASATGDASPAASSAMVVLLGALLALRRERPLAVLVAVLVVGVLGYTLAPVHVLFWGGMVPLMVAVYTVARHERSWRAWLAVGASALLLLALDLTMDGLLAPDDFAFRWANAALAFGIGHVLNRTEARGRASALQARAAEERVEQVTAIALADERARIAREMHDVVAHSVSVMVVQAGAAEAAIDEDPSYTRGALERIRTTGVEALEDMRRVLAVLRDDGPGRPLSPQPGLTDVHELVRETTDAGVPTDLVVEGTARPLPAGLDLTAYRIVQEALTNVRRHAAATRATVRLRYDGCRLEVEVVDDGRGGPAGKAHPPGHGLVGMRERASLYGGRLEAGAGEEGFRVHADLPLEPA